MTESRFEIQDGVLVRCCSNERVITVPPGVRVIGEDAFTDVDSMDSFEWEPPESDDFLPDPIGETIVLPEGVEEIEAGAFRDQEELLHIEFPDSLEIIREEAFQNSALESLRIPPRVTELPERVLADCDSLERLELPPGLKRIGEDALCGCSALETLLLPDSLEELGKGVFSRGGLRSVRIPPLVTEIPEGLFADCECLETVEFPEGLLAIRSEALANCHALKRVELPDSLVFVAEDAFEGASLECLRIPAGMGIPWEGLLEKMELKALEVPGRSLRTLPDSFVELAVQGIAEMEQRGIALEPGQEREAVEFLTKTWPQFLSGLPDNLSLLMFLLRRKILPWQGAEVLLQRALKEGNPEVAALMLDYRERLEEADDATRLEEALRELETGTLSPDAFDASWLARRDRDDGLTLVEYQGTEEEHLDLPSGRGEEPVVALAPLLLANADWLVSAAVPEGVREMGNSVFAGCPLLQSVTLPSTLKEIALYTFTGSSLVCVQMASGPVAIREGAFERCEHLTELIVPEGVKRIEKNAFLNCGSLARLVLPASLEEISVGAFGGCTALKTLEVDPTNPWLRSEGPFLLSRDGTVLFLALPSLDGEIAIPEGVEEIADSALAGCDALTAVTLPDSVKRVGPRAFSQCGALQSVRLGNGLEEIRELAFRGCSFEEVALPATLKVLDATAFEDCVRLWGLDLPAATRILFGTVEGHGFCNNCECLCLEVDPASPFQRMDGHFLMDREQVLRWAEPGGATGDARIPDGVAAIGPRAFGVSLLLESLEIPATVKDIGKAAFAVCQNLRELRFLGVPEKIAGDAIPWTLKTVRVPADVPQGAFRTWLDWLEKWGICIEKE